MQITGPDNCLYSIKRSRKEIKQNECPTRPFVDEKESEKDDYISPFFARESSISTSFYFRQ